MHRAMPMISAMAGSIFCSARAFRDTPSVARRLPSNLSENRIDKEAFQTLGILVRDHRSTHCHHERDGRINLLLRPLLRWIQVATPI